MAQSLGIAAGLMFNALALRRDIQARRTGDQILLTEQHRELWSEVHRRPELGRIFNPTADLAVVPLTSTEEQFLRLVFVHFHTGWLLARENSLLTLDVLARDAGDFFRLPVPCAAWQRLRGAMEPSFVRFIDAQVRLPEPDGCG